MIEEPVERERRFLVKDTSVTVGATWEMITQGYVFAIDGFAIRVRITSSPNEGGDSTERAWLTGKGPRVVDDRVEFDQEVSVAWASQVIQRCANVVEKRRYQVITDQTWEVDQFLGENDGLWIAELEGGAEIRSVPTPDWLAEEIRHDPRYDNEQLAITPYRRWADAVS